MSVKFKLACLMPRWMWHSLYKLRQRYWHRYDNTLESKIEDLRNLIVQHFPAETTPPAIGKLRLLQEGNTCLLKYFIRQCEQHGLRYWLTYGTLLGAVRHKGWIPWDDDMDVSMMYSDYEKLLQVLPNLFPKEDGFTIHQHAFLQIGYKGTPLNLDIFPHFFAAEPYSTEAAIKIARAWDKVKKKVVLMGRRMNYTEQEFLHVINREILGGKSSPAEEDSPATFMTPAATFIARRLILPYEAIFPLKKAVFEGTEMNVPQQARFYLSQLYGDYMDYPPKVGFQHLSSKHMIQKVAFEEAVNRFIDKYGV